MNPETGKFHSADTRPRAEQQRAGGEIGKDWPTFAIGEVIEIRGYQFKILRINVSSIVVQPIPTKGLETPRNLMRAMMGRGT